MSYLKRQLRIFIVIVASFWSVFSAKSQSYGLEWLEPSELHLKINVWENNICRLGYFSLEQFFADSGKLLSDIPFDEFTIFNMGKKVPIYIYDQNRNSRFDPLDYIEFFGKKADGRLDEGLYRNSSFQRHQLKNIVSDTNAYFLTMRKGGGNPRIKAYNAAMPANTNDYHIAEEVYAPDINYFQGEFVIIGDKVAHYSSYMPGEGFVGDWFSAGSSPNEVKYSVEFNTKDYYKAGPNPQLECGVVAATANRTTVQNNQHYILKVSPDFVNTRKLVDSSFSGVKPLTTKHLLDSNDIGSTTYVLFSPVLDPGISQSTWGHSHTILRYPKVHNLNDTPHYMYYRDSGIVAAKEVWYNYGSGQYSPVFFDENNGYRWTGQYDPFNRIIYASAPPSKQKSYSILVDESKIDLLGASRFTPVRTVYFSSHINQCDYIMITHPNLIGPENEVINYKTYWETRYKVQLNLITDLYDYFTFGIKHPLAVRYYCKYLLDKSAADEKPQFLLLLGRGYDNSFNRGNSSSLMRANAGTNLIPALGSPVSDWLYTTGLNGKNSLVPALATGRVPAEKMLDVSNYLDKVKAYRSPVNQYQDWQKQVLHLGGGATSGQASVISSRLQNLRSYVYRDPFAGVVSQYTKSASSTVDPKFRENILNRINNGVSLVTFLGHGSTSVTDIDIGDPNLYDNKNKYPIFYFNGCQIGNPCIPGQRNTLSEKIFRGVNKGGVAFVGQSDLSELYTVSDQMNAVYKVFFDTTPNKTLGEVLRTSIEQFSDSSALRRLHNEQLLLQGDPAVYVQSPTLPDYSVSDRDIFLMPENAFAMIDSFSVAVVVKNLGRGISDSVTIRMEWTYPDGVTRRNFYKRLPINGFQDTVLITVDSKDPLVRGDNLFKIMVNEDRIPAEFTYSNNTAAYKRYIPGNGIYLVSPKNFAILGTDTVELIAQAGDIFKQSEDYFFELDTTPWFNSPLLVSLDKQGTPMNKAIYARWRVSLPLLKDTQPWFWRARISTSAKEGGTWQTGTFTYIKGHQDGWMQNIHWQYIFKPQPNKFDMMYSDSASRTLKFSKLLKKIFIDCGYFNPSRKGVKESGFNSQDLNFGGCTDGIVAIPWNGRKLIREPVDITKSYPQCYWGTRWKTFGHFADYQLYYSFNMSNPAEQDMFVKFIDAVPDSNYVTIFIRNQSFAHLWSNDVLKALNRIGSNLFDSSELRTNDAMWVCLGKKGSLPGQAQEAHTFGSVNGYVQMEGDMLGDATQSTMTSTTIGPTDQFGELYFRPVKTDIPGVNQDEIKVNVIGIDTSGRNVILKSVVSPFNVNLAGINTQLYKYIYLEAAFWDDVGFSCPNLINWRLAMKPVPEGTIYPNRMTGYLFHQDTLYEGDSFKIQLPFRNISELAYKDSIFVEYDIYNKISRQSVDKGKFNIGALGPDSQWIFKRTISTIGLAGPYSCQVTFNAGFKQPEVTMVNNSATINFFVTKDVMNPVLDVTFDGRKIVNGEVVSANPVIMVLSKDENPFLLQQDSQKIKLFIKKPGAAQFDPVPTVETVYTPANGKNNKAQVEYKPQNLDGGMHILKVQSWDYTNNASGSYQYEVAFNVVKEQSVTRFYPYPNPFSTRMRFVFTLTGSKLPDDIKVKIMNLEGKMVKEVTMAELGNLHIGNNITDWSWDGTDQYGDKLANGTYFYRVSVTDNGEELKLRESKGDAAFKEQTGVIYLMR